MELPRSQPPAGLIAGKVLFSEWRLPMLVTSPLLTGVLAGVLARVFLHIYYFLLANEESKATGAADSPVRHSPERQGRFKIQDQATGFNLSEYPFQTLITSLES